MAELTVRRVIVACDAVCDIRPAVEEAAALAARWHAALHGVFLEDENLYRLAALPFGRQISLSSLGASESFAAADLEKLSSALGSAMRQALAEVAARRGLTWSFGTLRDLPTVSAMAGIEGDLLIVESAARPFAGSWRPRSPWDQLAEEPARPILLRRRGSVGRRIVLVLVSNGTDWERTLGAGFAMAGGDEEIVVLVGETAAVGMEAVRRSAERFAAAWGRKFQVKSASADGGALLRSVQRLDPSLIVMDSRGADGVTMRALMAATRCDVLLMR